MKTINQIRQSFLDYFVKNDHTHVKSSSLVPHNDPTLMFTNSGMVQFKDLFLGKEKRDYVRATTSQKCVRAGGKHNDLENVGYTARHLTFFEMLGNFSFGDYFKERAIKHAWEFVTKELELPKDKLYVTVYHTDVEAANFWKKLAGLSDDRIIKIKTDANFWSMGDTGPCGPCSEIFYDHGDKIFGGLPGTKDEDGDRYVEIWNLVFMQYEQSANGHRTELAKQSIDTGMGLERLSAIMQGVQGNFDIDLFKMIIRTSEDITGAKATGSALTSHRVIADHLRSSAFLIADGVVPSNEGRGYVLRRIMRRAIRHINALGYSDILLPQLLPALTGEMGAAYHELIEKQDFIAATLRAEEESFRETLGRGLKLLHKELDASAGKVFSGETAFKLHDTYGFPVDLTKDILREKSIEVDMPSFEACMQQQKDMARAAWSGSGDASTDKIWFDIKAEFGATEFLGYSDVHTKGKVLALIQNNTKCAFINNSEKFFLITNQTPFYGESGGQVGDKGEISAEELKITVLDTIKPIPGLYVHVCELKKGVVKQEDIVSLNIDLEYRNNVKKNHTATHLLHAILRNKLGKHVMQKGSIVKEDKLRFDFSHTHAIPRSVLDEIETEINALILRNIAVKTELLPYETAVSKGAMALFNEKYDSEVRVVFIEDMDEAHSIELCGGTHVSRLGDIGLFKIVSEAAIAAGIRRIEAVTGAFAVACFQNTFNTLREISGILQVSEAESFKKVQDNLKYQRELEKSQAVLQESFVLNALKASKSKELAKLSFVCEEVKGFGVNELKGAIQKYLMNQDSTFAVLFSRMPDKILYSMAISKDLDGVVDANVVAQSLSAKFSAKGGGSKLMAQGSMDAGENLSTIIDHIISTI